MKEQLDADPSKRPALVADACRVLDAEVADKAGLSGMGIRGAYKVVKGVKPGFIPDVVDMLLDDFVAALEPIYRQAVEAGAPPSRHLEEHRGEVADALLAITDRRADRSQLKSVKALYRKLRPSAKKHVEEAAPRLGQLLEQHAESAS